VSTKPRIDLEGADRITVGTSDTTMRIWLLLDRVGEEGLSRADIEHLAGPHVNAGYARRRYLAKRKLNVKGNSEYRARRYSAPTWETTELEPARRFVIGQILGGMKRRGSVVLGQDGRYRAARQPVFQRDISIIDLDGDRTRIHMNTAHALRILEPAATRFRESTRAQLNGREREAFLKLLELTKELLRP
jgi:hypothetical protein